jgi:hypothetical protein
MKIKVLPIIFAATTALSLSNSVSAESAVFENFNRCNALTLLEIRLHNSTGHPVVDNLIEKMNGVYTLIGRHYLKDAVIKYQKQVENMTRSELREEVNKCSAYFTNNATEIVEEIQNHIN